MDANGTTETTEAEVCPPGTVPTGCAVPMSPVPRMPPGCMIVRREIVWCGAGLLIGGALMYWFINSLSAPRRRDDR